MKGSKSVLKNCCGYCKSCNKRIKRICDKITAKDNLHEAAGL